MHFFFSFTPLYLTDRCVESGLSNIFTAPLMLPALFGTFIAAKWWPHLKHMLNRGWIFLLKLCFSSLHELMAPIYSMSLCLLLSVCQISFQSEQSRAVFFFSLFSLSLLEWGVLPRACTEILRCICWSKEESRVAKYDQWLWGDKNNYLLHNCGKKISLQFFL